MCRLSSSSVHRVQVRLSSTSPAGIVLLCTVLVASFLLSSTLALPLDRSSPSKSPDGKRNVDGSESDYDYSDTFTPLPPRFTTEPPTIPPCFRELVRNISYKEGGVWRNTTLPPVRICCPGYFGADCNRRIDEAGSNITDTTLNCSNVVCEGNSEAFCAEFTRCGRTIPMFLTLEGKLAECDNGQPSTLSRLSCTPVCSRNPCAGLECPAFPEAMCATSICDCKPLWFLPDGVHVDCAEGKTLTPDESKRRRRNLPDPSSETQNNTTTSCS